MDNLKQYPFFTNYIRVLNSIHLLITIKGKYKQQAPQHSRKSILIQNVLAAINFNINFIYILARQEGTAYNYKVINLIKKKGFKAL